MGDVNKAMVAGKLDRTPSNGFQLNKFRFNRLEKIGFLEVVGV